MTHAHKLLDEMANTGIGEWSLKWTRWSRQYFIEFKIVAGYMQLNVVAPFFREYLSLLLPNLSTISAPPPVAVS